MTAALILRWLAGNWKQIAGAALIGVVIISASSFYSSWKMRGVKIDRLQIELDSEQFARANDRAVCAELAAQLREQQAAVELWMLRHREANERHVKAMQRASVNAESLRIDAESASVNAVEAIRRAQGCEGKVTALAVSLRRWQQ